MNLPLHNSPRTVELSQSFFFDAAHTLARKDQGKLEADSSRRIHGHTYHAEVTLRGTVNPQSGMLVDLAQLRAHIEALRQKLDHHFLDDIPGLAPATLERLASYIADQLQPVLPALYSVTVQRKASGDKCVLRLV